MIQKLFFEKKKIHKLKKRECENEYAGFFTIVSRNFYDYLYTIYIRGFTFWQER